MDSLDDPLRERIERLLGARLIGVRAVGGGYTPAGRFQVDLEGGASAFVKVGASPDTCAWLRRESQVYRTVDAPFMPELRGWDDDPEAPILALEDLSGATWPPPWNDEAVAAVRDSIAAMHATPASLPPFAEVHPHMAEGWAAVEREPGILLRLDLVSEEWLEAALPRLRLAESVVATEGTVFTHFDLRSDNLCLTERGAVFVDWNHACLGDPQLDLGFWLPSLADEGGPLPDEILPEAPEVAAWVSGFFAARAGLPDIPDAPRVRDVQRAQLVSALAWTARALGLPPPGADGARR